MIQLIELTERNWLDVARLSVSDKQKQFLDSPVGIIARGYVYRHCNAKVHVISNNDTIIGLALVRDLNEFPPCYDLQQFMIDARFQNKGYGTEALTLILMQLRAEGKYDCVEVCVHKEDASALRVYEKLGFVNTGYIDEDAPNCLNLRYSF